MKPTSDQPEQFAEKLRLLEITLADKLGPFSFFALLLPGETDGWDLLFIADWADRLPKLDAIGLMITEMRGVLSEATMLNFERILTFRAETVALAPVFEDHPAEHGLVEIADEDILGLTIRRGYIITCKDRPAEKPAPRAKATKKKQPVAVA